MMTRKIYPKFFIALALVIGLTVSTLPMAFAETPIMLDEYVTARDGVVLYTKVYLPDPAVWGPGPYPTIVSTTPYGVGKPGIAPSSWPSQPLRGYAYVNQDTRGRYLSGGMWTRRDDGRDGYDTIEWAAKQPWCNGCKIGMSGSSAVGLTTYMTAGLRPPHLVAIQPSIASANALKHFTFEGGALQFETTLAWRSSNVNSGLSQSHYDALGLSPEELAAAKATMDAVNTDIQSHLANPLDSAMWTHLPLFNFPGISPLLPSWNEFLLHPSSLDHYYDPFNVQDTITVPGLHWGGWYDIYGRGILESFQAIQSNVGNQKLLMTNGVHRTVGGKYPPPASPYYPWFDYWLKGIDTGIMDQPPVVYYRMEDTRTSPGTGEWRYADEWPLPDVKREVYYLRSDGTLSHNFPMHKDPSISFDYDPRSPVPTMGGRNLYIPSGARDQAPVENRSDVLIYTTAELKEDVEVSGKVKVVLHASSNRTDTDFVAKLTDVYPDGRSILILDSVIRARYRDSLINEKLLHPGQRYELTIDLGDTSQLFKAGHRIRVDISSSNFPIRDRNPNTGHALYLIDTPDDLLVATNTIYHQFEHPSYVELPIVQKKTRIFAGNASITTPSVTYSGPAELHTLSKGVYLFLTNLNRWVKWDIERERDSRLVEVYACKGKLGELTVTTHSEGPEPYYALASGKGVSFEGNPK